MASKKESKFIIDAGNTRLKIAHFQGDSIQSIQFFDYSNLAFLKSNLFLLSSKKTILSSVLSDELNEIIVNSLNPTLFLTTKTAIPIKSKYHTPETLGTDRKANAVAIHTLNKKKTATLAIDIGTCIKFDVVNSDGEYLGGSISPGIRLRFKSMNDYTGKLPLISDYSKCNLVGRNTEESLKSGVINGITHEINAMISSYEERFGGLTTFMTGGDAKVFDIHSKFDIFAVENLTLIGLNIILEYNA